MLTNEIRKGTRVQLRNGWYATVEDNQTRQATRMCTVEGYVTEMGSVYTTDIVKAIVDGAWVEVTLTEKQKQSKVYRALAGF